MKYLDASTGTRANKIVKGFYDLREENGWEPKVGLQIHFQAEALAKRFEGRQIVMLVDEISSKGMLSKMGDLVFPETVRMILVLNPKKKSNEKPLTLPPSFLHVTLSTPYRSTIAITSLARFIAKCNGLVVPEGDFGSDVEGTKPIIFDVDSDDRKMEEALEECHKRNTILYEVFEDEREMKEALGHCRKHLGDNATILYGGYLSPSIEKMVKKLRKEEGGPWDYSDANKFCGWEAERVVLVTEGTGEILEMITRARTHLSVILVESCNLLHFKKFFQGAVDLGLVDKVQLGAEVNETS